MAFGCLLYTSKDEADLTAKNIRLFPDRVEFEAVTLDGISRVRLPIPGGFSIYNALGVLACTQGLGLPLSAAAEALAHVNGVKGRVEVVPTPAPYTVIIDYAHTPDALENILTTVRDLAENRVVCLFGCGGDRDRSKRPVMGEMCIRDRRGGAHRPGGGAESDRPDAGRGAERPEQGRAVSARHRRGGLLLRLLQGDQPVH